MIGPLSAISASPGFLFMVKFIGHDDFAMLTGIALVGVRSFIFEQRTTALMH